MQLHGIKTSPVDFTVCYYCPPRLQHHTTSHHITKRNRKVGFYHDLSSHGHGACTTQTHCEPIPICNNERAQPLPFSLTISNQNQNLVPTPNYHHYKSASKLKAIVSRWRPVCALPADRNEYGAQTKQHTHKHMQNMVICNFIYWIITEIIVCKSVLMCNLGRGILTNAVLSSVKCTLGRGRRSIARQMFPLCRQPTIAMAADVLIHWTRERARAIRKN